MIREGGAMPGLRSRPISLVLLLPVSVLAAVGCGLQISLNAEAHDQWTRHYTLAQGGALEIHNTNGRIEISPGEGDAVDVDATRTVKAPTDAEAQDALKSFEITESVSPDRILIDSTTHGINLGFSRSRRVDFVVHVPRWAGVTLETTNGDVNVTGLGGPFRTTATNGRIKATALEGGVTIRTTNGAVSLDVARLSDADISCRTTNGAISLTLPEGASAQISASVTNGTIRTSKLDLRTTESSRRRLDASLGVGGPLIHLQTTNGLIEITGK
jgi:Toastrack DUF4097